MKQLYIFTGLLFSIQLCLAIPSLQETKTYISQASPQEAQLLLNLVYWSYQRSATTLSAQDILLKHFEESWMVWQNCAATRRNPRTALPYPNTTSVDTMSANIAADNHFRSNALYVQALTYAVEQPNITTPLVKDYIAAMRSEARVLATQAALTELGEVKQTLQQLNNSSNFLKEPWSLLSLKEKQHERKINYQILTEGIQHLVNGFALQSFGKFDREYITRSKTLFTTLLLSQQLYNKVWHKLETARAKFYQQTYGLLYTAMVELQFPANSFLQAFNEHGIIPSSQQEPLPATIH